jgi:zinc resistance-associated protein
MKKVFVVTALVVGLGFFGSQQASANWGMNGGACMGTGSLKGEPCYTQLDAATKVKVDKFFDDTKDLRKQIIMKNAEEHAVMSSVNPDPAKAASLAGEMYDLRTSMQTKADAAGVTGLIRCGDCDGPGQNMGPRGGGHMIKRDRAGKNVSPAAAPAAPARTDAK